MVGDVYLAEETSKTPLETDLITVMEKKMVNLINHKQYEIADIAHTHGEIL